MKPSDTWVKAERLVKARYEELERDVWEWANALAPQVVISANYEVWKRDVQDEVLRRLLIDQQVQIDSLEARLEAVEGLAAPDEEATSK